MYKVLLAAAALVASSTAQFFPGGQPLYGGQCDYQGFLNCQTQQWQGKPEAAQGCVQIQGGGPNCVRQTTVCDQQCVRGYAYQKVK
ncbi:hypothetical protein CKM354_000231000 [Cercospora kikuchii]|uniref:Uncharacterized protein n=1 Tax=Cercospora kikuchii TaxID=84275 RepID=A0A9P3F957_9PEZI|nr:uncharacterized protein CKM354_000231000 [Cercospora kikuchii]GIZ38911.1 hypothetical protein CKM354_000231000 [Cercospora kikuchii]